MAIDLPWLDGSEVPVNMVVEVGSLSDPNSLHVPPRPILELIGSVAGHDSPRLVWLPSVTIRSGPINAA